MLFGNGRLNELIFSLLGNLLSFLLQLLFLLSLGLLLYESSLLLLLFFLIEGSLELILLLLLELLLLSSLLLLQFSLNLLLGDN